MVKKSPTGSSKKRPTRRKYSPPIKEGEWFAFPLHPRERGFAVGLAARVSPSTGTLFGYFFGPVRKALPSLAEMVTLKPSDAIWLGMVGPMGLEKGEWLLLGKLENWRRADWPMPALLTRSTSSNRPRYVTRYSEDDPHYPVEVLEIHGKAPVEETAPYEQLPEDGLAGHVFAEKVVSRLLTAVEMK